VNRDALIRAPWLWALLGVLAVWALQCAASGTLSVNALLAAVGTAAFLAIAALAQSFPMMTAPGNVDLSIPSVITLSGYMSVQLISGSNEAALPGLLLGMGIGAAVGVLNAVCILILRIPAIIATLATGYVVTTLCLLENRSLSANTAAPVLRFVASGEIAGIPAIALVVIALSVGIAFLYGGTGFGRMLLATGQNRSAAALAGVPVGRVVTLAFVLSGMLAGALGVLLAARSGGAFLDMGESYLLLSIGAVVIGGTPVFGGRVTVIGCLVGAWFLVLLNAALPLLGIRGGGQEILQGAIIVLVLVVGSIRAASVARA